MSLELEHKVALVTGGGTGIGEAIARALVAAGAAVAISGRRREVLDGVVETLIEAGGRALAVQGDVSIRDDAARMVESTVATFGALNVVVNNAGIARGGELLEMSSEDIDATIDIDLKGPIYVTRAALPHLRKNRETGGSVVINISSSVTRTVLKNYSVYSAAKAGLDQLSRCWALEFAADRIRVNGICPGIVDTPIFEAVMPPAVARRYLRLAVRDVPLGRAGQPDEVAQLVLYLVGPQAAWMTGAIVTLDGGVSLMGNV